MKTLIRVSIAAIAILAVVGLSSCTSTGSNPHSGDYHSQKHGG